MTSPYDAGLMAGFAAGRSSITAGRIDAPAVRLPADHADAADWLIGYAAGIRHAARTYLGSSV